MNHIKTLDGSHRQLEAFSEWKGHNHLICARHLVVLDYSADGDSVVEQVPHCSAVSLPLQWCLSVARGFLLFV